MKNMKNYQVCFFVMACIFLNYFGKLFADKCALPVWLDSIGTVFSAYILGPFCGAVVGATVNIIYSIHSDVALYYGLTNITVGIIVGMCAKKGLLKSLFGTLSTAVLVTVVSVLISSPLNFAFADGSTGNIWGDGMSLWLQKIDWNRNITNIVGEFYIDFLDKFITMLSLYAIIRIKNSNRVKEYIKQLLSVGIIVVLIFIPYNQVNAKEVFEIKDYNFQKYTRTVYNGEKGLPSGEANTVSQTKDGVLWVGNYGGLYRYNGNSFQWMNEFESVRSVNCLYTDEAGRLWIGTNDNGLSICINQKISNVVNKKDGLSSDSVRCIVENSQGYYYVGTTDSLVVMSLSGGLKVYDTIPEIVYADSICTDKNGNVATVTNGGDLYLVNGTEVTGHYTAQNTRGAYNCCAFDNEGRLYVGTSSNTIEVFEINGKKIKKVSVISCGNLIGVNSINFFEESTLFICADNGVGYVNTKGKFIYIDTGSFNSSIENMLVDYQGNLWFTSSRQGLLRLCQSVFKEIYKSSGLSENVVNTVTSWRGCLYFGTDSGLDVVDKKSGKKVENFISQKLKDARIRCLLVDSKKNLWVCTSDSGIWRITKKDEIKIYNSQNGTIGDKFRSAIELADGSIAIAGDSGITFIRDGVVYDTIGFSEGLSNPRVLSMIEKGDGTILVGTDGNGIAVVNDGKVIASYSKDDGLSSDIILRIVPELSGSGFFIVTGNGLCYMDKKGDIRILDNFPYYNNYDVVDEKNGKLFVLTSAGIYIVDKKDLLKGKDVRYELLDNKKGLRMSLTPNSWNYLDGADNLYISGDKGVVCLNLNEYDITERSYRMLLQEIVVDGKTYTVEKGEAINIPRGANDVEFTPEIVNYSVNDPNIRVYLEGFDSSIKTMSQSKMTTFIYKNLPSGEYTFHVAVLDSRTDGIIAENTYRIVKEKEICDNWWFRLYAGIVAAIAIAFLTWFFFRTQMQKTLRLQKMELELTKRQLEMGNEVILTIAQTVDAKDENTSQHSLRVSQYSVMIAKKLGYSEEECEQLRKIAMLHDIGKIGIPDRVLNKPERLNDEEYAIMKSHVKIGADILKNFTLIDNVADGAFYHHERYDGRGYVSGLKGEEIPLNARIIGIADAFDAMTANRVYRKKLDFGYVMEELKKGKGTQFDPKLVDILLELIEDGTIDIGKIYE